MKKEINVEEELKKAHYYLAHVYLNWGRAFDEDLEVKEDFAEGFNILSRLLEEKWRLKPTDTGWKFEKYER